MSKFLFSQKRPFLELACQKIRLFCSSVNSDENAHLSRSSPDSKVFPEQTYPQIDKFNYETKIAECLQKYECSIKQALELDPKSQQRIVIKGLVIGKILKGDKIKLKLMDTNTMEQIRVFLPDHAYKASSNIINKGSQVVLTGLVFGNLETKKNSLFCDKVIYSNFTTLKLKNKLFELDNTITDWFNLRNFPTQKFRSQRLAPLIKLRSVLINQIHKLMTEEQFIHVTPPVLTSFPNLGEDDLFKIVSNNREDYFHTDVYLNKEFDKHLESIVNAIPQIYTITHSFNSNLTRSKQVANELINLEVSQSTDDNLDDLMNQIEYFIKKLSYEFTKDYSHIIHFLTEDQKKFNCKLRKIDVEYLRLTYEEALELLSKKDINLKFGEQLNFYHKYLISNYFENNPVFIHDFPYELCKDFDTLNVNNKAQRFELLIGNGLTCGKGKIKSKDNFDELSNKLKELNCDLNQEDINKDNISWYLDLKKKGSVPSTWFSISLNHYLMALTNLPSLRDIILFPRTPNYCES